MIQNETKQAPDEKWIVAGALAVFMTLVVRNAWVTEDAFLTMRTIDNWVGGYGLRWNTDERVQAYTHPLWMFIVAVPYALLRHPYAAALITGLAFTLAAAYALIRISRSSGHAVTAIVLLLLSRSVIDYSTSGLENPLSHLLIAVLVWLYALRESRPLWMALCAGALALNRVDTLLVTVLPLIHTSILGVRERGWKQTAKELAIGFAPYLAWELFSLVYYGFLVPNTAFAKLNTGIARRDLQNQGVVYVLHTLAWDPSLLAIVLVGVIACAVRRELRTTLLVLSGALYVVYVISVGGDFMKGRFLTIPVFLSSCLVAISALPLQRLANVGAVLLPLLVLYLHPSGTDLHHSYTGEEDEREFYENELGLMALTRARSMPQHIFRDEGEAMAVRAGRDRVQTHFNVGITGFYAGPHVHIVDENALSDPLLARLPARYNPDWRIGHYTRFTPPGYLDSIRTGTCKMSDAAICEYYAHLTDIISGDVWSWQRFVTIAKMNFGAYSSLIDQDRYRFPDVQHAPLAGLSAPIPEDAAWNDPRARKLTSDGIEIALPALSHAKRVEMTFDGNDLYEIVFAHDRTRHRRESPSIGLGGMHTRTIEVPAAAASKGFDHIVVRPTRGDGMYSVGYVRLVE